MHGVSFFLTRVVMGPSATKLAFKKKSFLISRLLFFSLLSVKVPWNSHGNVKKCLSIIYVHRHVWLSYSVNGLVPFFLFCLPWKTWIQELARQMSMHEIGVWKTPKVPWNLSSMWSSDKREEKDVGGASQYVWAEWMWWDWGLIQPIQL